MKMSDKLFNDLRRDMDTVLEAHNADVRTIGDAWQTFHLIMRDRSYGDDHPGYRQGKWNRVLPRTEPDGRNWIDRFYRDEDLTDDHIMTAFRKMFPNMPTHSSAKTVASAPD